MKVTIGTAVSLSDDAKSRYDSAQTHYEGDARLDVITLGVRVSNSDGLLLRSAEERLSVPNHGGNMALNNPMVLIFVLDEGDTGEIVFTLTLPCRTTYRLVRHRIGTCEFSQNKAIDGTTDEKGIQFGWGSPFTLGSLSVERYDTEAEAVAAKVIAGCRSIREGENEVPVMEVAATHALVGMYAPKIGFLHLVDHDNIQEKLVILGNRLEQTKTQFFEKYVEAIEGVDDHYIKVFMVPEYFFRKNDWTATPTPFSEEDKDDIVARLRDLSADYPDVLLIPGTIFHCSDATPHVNVAAPENLAVGDGADFDRVVVQDGHLVKNEAPILWDGAVYTWSRKHRDAAELPAAERGDYAYEYRPATVHTVCQFQFPDDLMIRCGLEICQDHATARLKHVKGNVRDLHIQFIISAGTNAYPKNAVTPVNGLIFRCDGGSVACSRERGPNPEFSQQRYQSRPRISRSLGFASRITTVTEPFEHEDIKAVAFVDEQDLAWFDATLSDIAGSDE